MSAIAHDQRLFDSWEVHSELVLVDPDLRRRSLELCPEPADVIANAGVRAPTPKLGVESARGAIALVRVVLHDVGRMTRFGLMVVGLLFSLAMLAELLPH